jgi:cytoskeletal protein CcmA (bactofilin family)
LEKSKDKGFNTLIGEGAVFEGVISVPHSVRIDGMFKGKIETVEMLTIGTEGIVEAEIKARNLILGGKLTGNIIVEERVELESSALHNGNLQTRELIINQGASFNGCCSMEVNPIN